MSLLSIRQALSLDRIASIVNLTAPAGLTSTGKCPFCNAFSLITQQDPVSCEEWQYCSQCNRYGTPLTMASELLGLSLAGTIEHIAAELQLSFPQEIVNQLLEVENKRKIFWNFWEDSRTRLMAPSRAHIVLQVKLKWAFSSHLDGTRAYYGPGRLFGLNMTSRAVEILGARLKRKDACCLVVPYFSGPRKIEGFQIVTETQQTYVSVSDRSNGGVNSRIKGLAFSEHVDLAQHDLLIVSSLLRVAGMLQTRNISKELPPLPILSWFDEGVPYNAEAWSYLGGRKIVMLESTLTPSVVQQALNHDARVSLLRQKDRAHFNLTRETTTELAKWLAVHSPAAHVKKIISDALPLPVAIRSWGSKVSANEANILLGAAESYPQEVYNVLKHNLTRSGKSCAARATYNRIDVVDPAGHASLPVRLTERNHATYDSQGLLRFPGIVRVTHVVTRDDIDIEYVGIVQIKNTELPFKVARSRLVDSWFYDFLSSENPIYLEMYRRSSTGEDLAADTLISFSLSRHTPMYCKGVERLGWDGEGFQFYRMRIEKGRVISIPDYVFPGKCIGPDYTTLITDSPFLTAVGSDNKGLAVAWGLATALCAVATAPVVGLPPLPIIIDRDCYDEAIYRLLDQFQFPATTRRDWKHNWFRRFRIISDRKIYRIPTWSILLSCDMTPSTITKAMGYRLKTKELVEPVNISKAVSKIALLYLQHFTAQPLKHRQYDWPYWHKFTLREMAVCFKHISSPAFKRRSRLLTLQNF